MSYMYICFPLSKTTRMSCPPFILKPSISAASRLHFKSQKYLLSRLAEREKLVRVPKGVLTVALVQIFIRSSFP